MQSKKDEKIQEKYNVRNKTHFFFMSSAKKSLYVEERLKAENR